MVTIGDGGVDAVAYGLPGDRGPSPPLRFEFAATLPPTPPAVHSSGLPFLVIGVAVAVSRSCRHGPVHFDF